MKVTPEQIAKGGSEDAHQKALFAWASTYPELKWMHSIPNGGARDKVTAALMKATGVKRGVHDIFVPLTRRGYAGLYIELKKEFGGEPSTEQIEFEAHAKAQGYAAFICHGWIEARNCVSWYVWGVD